MNFSNSTFFIMKDGSVICCGNNQYGQLGFSSTSSQSRLSYLPFSGVRKIVCGLDHTFFIMKDGTIKCCGYNYYGQLGLEDTSNRTSPVNHPLTGVMDIVCGGRHTFFLMEDGTIKCCGYNGNGQLGLGDTNKRTSPVNHPLTGVMDIVCGGYHTFFIMEDGIIKSCGLNSDGQLGLDHNSSSRESAPKTIPFTGVKAFASYTSIDNNDIYFVLSNENINYTIRGNQLIELDKPLSQYQFKKRGFANLDLLYTNIESIIRPMDFDRKEGEGRLFKKTLNINRSKKIIIS